MRTDAERHRLILSHTYLIPMLASSYRGARGIPFDELEGAGMIGLCEAASDWGEKEDFAKFANVAVRNQIKNFIKAWCAPPDPDDPFSQKVIAGENSNKKFYEWQIWNDQQYIFAISEYWEELIATPIELKEAFDKIKSAGDAIKSATIGFGRRDRDILNARYFTDPPSSIESIARHHKISYARTVFLIDRMLKKIRKILESREAATPVAMRG